MDCYVQTVLTPRGEEEEEAGASANYRPGMAPYNHAIGPGQDYVPAVSLFQRRHEST